MKWTAFVKCEFHVKSESLMALTRMMEDFCLWGEVVLDPS